MIVELPKDHEGREIPLDTEVLYDNNGMKFNVDEFKFYAWPSLRKSFWTTRGAFEDEEEPCNFLPHLLHLVQPDSWKRLLDDLDMAASKTYCGTCTYFGKNPTDCDTCAIGDITSCDSAAMRDIASRIRKLRGKGE